MKKLLLAALLLTSINAHAATAFWTGRQEQVQTVTYQYMWRCEYSYLGQYYYALFSGMCASSIDIY